MGKVCSILLTTAAYIITDATKLTMYNNIDIVFLDASQGKFHETRIETGMPV